MGSIQVTPELLNDPEALVKFQQAQGAADERPVRLLVVEKIIQTRRRDANFRDLQAWLLRAPKSDHGCAGTLRQGGRNLQRRCQDISEQPDGNDVRLQTKANFSVDNEQAISEPPKVNFGSAPTPAGTLIGWSTLSKLAPRHVAELVPAVCVPCFSVLLWFFVVQNQGPVPTLRETVTDLAGLSTSAINPIERPPGDRG